MKSAQHGYWFCERCDDVQFVPKFARGICPQCAKSMKFVSAPAAKHRLTNDLAKEWFGAMRREVAA